MKVSANIKLINQDDDTSCVLACLAMLTGTSMKVARESARELRMTCPLNDLEFLRLLALHGLLGIRQAEDNLFGGELYKVCVPSLNFAAGFHAVIIDLRELHTPKLYDPQNGREGRKFYGMDLSLGEGLKYISAIRIVDV